jgi:hypothetical protein
MDVWGGMSKHSHAALEFAAVHAQDIILESRNASSVVKIFLLSMGCILLMLTICAIRCFLATRRWIFLGSTFLTWFGYVGMFLHTEHDWALFSHFAPLSRSPH